MTDATSLYRHFAADGSLLYVGISLSWPARTRAHSRHSTWFEHVAKVEIEHFRTRAEALDAERAAIKREKPKFNVVHNRPDKPTRRTIFQRGAVDASPEATRFLSARERRRLERQNSDPLLRKIKGPHAIVGPALVYKGETISVLIAHGTFGTVGELAEVVLGKLAPEAPEWASAAASVILIMRADELTISQARKTRLDMIQRLKSHLETVQAYDTDLGLATAYATQFPSEKSRRILDEVAAEKGALA